MKLSLIILAVALCEARPRDVDLTARASVAAPFIINGSPADISNFPYQCSLRYAGSHTCGCSVLNAGVVLTAAHCVDGRVATAFSVLAGSTDRTVSGDIDASGFTMNSAYDGNAGGFPNDIATVALTSNLNLGDPNIAAASLPPNNNDQFVGSQCTITGWGRTGTSNILPATLQQVTMPIISNAECASRMSSVSGANVNDGHICIYNGDSGSCNGDSGGPMNCQGYVAGVTSWGISSALGNCMVSYPSVYTRTSYFLSWIANNS
uniref:Chymotrypsinogen n=1 Tax=Arenicola marina TaxID=6344 RepID=Q27444_AREMA|nr:chymotrypsinogen [Arenicola marina]